jgi:hypothetical protein
MVFCYYDSPVGRLLVGGRKKLAFISFPKGKSVMSPKPDWIHDTKPFSEVLSQLDRYFNGTLTRFSLDYVLDGTPFQRRVWQELATVPLVPPSPMAGWPGGSITPAPHGPWAWPTQKIRFPSSFPATG